MYTIVIADDETELREALIRRIDWDSVGFQVVGEAENGIEALELVEKLLDAQYQAAREGADREKRAC